MAAEYECGTMCGSELIEATERGDVDAVKELLKYECGEQVDLEAKDIYGGTALLSAAVGGHNQILGMIIAAGADVNAPDLCGFPALMNAAQQNHAKTLSQLLKSGADP